jgi:hypothetical protein
MDVPAVVMEDCNPDQVAVAHEAHDARAVLGVGTDVAGHGVGFPSGGRAGCRARRVGPRAQMSALSPKLLIVGVSGARGRFPRYGLTAPNIAEIAENKK